MIPATASGRALSGRMTPQESSKQQTKWEDKEVPTRPLAVIVGIMSIGCCLCCGPLVLTFGPSEVLAKILVPPAYPGSMQVNHWRSSGPDSMWEESTYHTTDSIDKVLVFMEANMPGFEQTNDSKPDYPLYVNGRSDNGPLGILASLAVDPPIHPGVSVAIYRDRDDPAITVIQVRVEWPAQ